MKRDNEKRDRDEPQEPGHREIVGRLASELDAKFIEVAVDNQTPKEALELVRRGKVRDYNVAHYAANRDYTRARVRLYERCLPHRHRLTRLRNATGDYEIEGTFDVTPKEDAIAYAIYKKALKALRKEFGRDPETGKRRDKSRATVPDPRADYPYRRLKKARALARSRGARRAKEEGDERD